MRSAKSGFRTRTEYPNVKEREYFSSRRGEYWEDLPMLRHKDRLLDLVGAIHLAAADPDPAAWPGAIENLRDALGGAGVMVGKDQLPAAIVAPTDVRHRTVDAVAATDAQRATLRLLDRGVILADAAARIAFAHPVAERLLARQDGLTLNRVGALVASR